jgi:hypothetical protein
VSNLHKALIAAAGLLVGAAFLSPAQAWPLAALDAGNGGMMGRVMGGGMMNMNGGMMNSLGGAIGGMMGGMTGGQTGSSGPAHMDGMGGGMAGGGCGAMMQGRTGIPNSLFPRGSRPSPNQSPNE